MTDIVHHGVRPIGSPLCQAFDTRTGNDTVEFALNEQRRRCDRLDSLSEFFATGDSETGRSSRADDRFDRPGLAAADLSHLEAIGEDIGWDSFGVMTDDRERVGDLLAGTGRLPVLLDHRNPDAGDSLEEETPGNDRVDSRVPPARGYRGGEENQASQEVGSLRGDENRDQSAHRVSDDKSRFGEVFEILDRHLGMPSHGIRPRGRAISESGQVEG